MGPHVLIILVLAFGIMGCTLFQDEVDKKLSECEKTNSMVMYQACSLSVVSETAKTNPERAKKACERIRDNVEQSVKAQIKGSEFYTVQAEFVAKTVYDICLSEVNRAQNQ
jgi:hypothetical protein